MGRHGTAAATPPPPVPLVLPSPPSLACSTALDVQGCSPHRARPFGRGCAAFGGSARPPTRAPSCSAPTFSSSPCPSCCQRAAPSRPSFPAPSAGRQRSSAADPRAAGRGKMGWRRSQAFFPRPLEKRKVVCRRRGPEAAPLLHRAFGGESRRRASGASEPVASLRREVEDLRAGPGPVASGWAEVRGGVKGQRPSPLKPRRTRPGCAHGAPLLLHSLHVNM